MKLPTPSQKIAILLGPTASGKTQIAMDFATLNSDLELINADSVIVYREFNIGSAKPDAQALSQVPHHLVDCVAPNEDFTAGDFLRLTHRAIEDIHARGKRALVVGGTGFYLKALLFGLWNTGPGNPKLRTELQQKSSAELFETLKKTDPQSAARIGPTDHYRLVRAVEVWELTGKTATELEENQTKNPDPRFKLWFIDRDPLQWEYRLRTRIQEQIKQGFIEETQTLRKKYPSARALGSVGYAQVCNFLDQITPEGRKIQPGVAGLEDEIVLATRQMIRRQRQWFRSQLQDSIPSQVFLLDAERASLDEAYRTEYQISP